MSPQCQAITQTLPWKHNRFFHGQNHGDCDFNYWRLCHDSIGSCCHRKFLHTPPPHQEAGWHSQRFVWANGSHRGESWRCDWSTYFKWKSKYYHRHNRRGAIQASPRYCGRKTQHRTDKISIDERRRYPQPIPNVPQRSRQGANKHRQHWDTHQQRPL